MDTRTVVVSKEICSECKGNGFIKVPYEQAKEEVFANCDNCNSQGEIKIIKESNIDERKI
tara:strand:- start:15 stop:194 length:180 start_codon:yes stop_codon:yes gene_type:complete